MSRRNGLIVGATVLLCLAILFDWLPLLRGPAPETAEWYWPYQLRPITRWWLPILLTTLLGASIWAWLERRIGVVGGLLLLTMLHIGLQLGFVYADASRTWLGAWEGISAELLDRTLPPLTSGYFWDAAHIDAINPLLRDYPAQMPQFESEHSRTHPPGLILLNYGLINTLQRAQFLAQPLHTFNNTLRCADLWLTDQRPAISAALTIAAWLPILAASTSIPLTYLVAMSLFAPHDDEPKIEEGEFVIQWDKPEEDEVQAEEVDDSLARMAVALVVALPSLNLFAPKVDQLFVPIMLVAMLLLLRGRVWTTFAGAVVISLLTFMSIGNAVIGFLLIPLWFFSLWFKPQAKEASTLKRTQDTTTTLHLSFLLRRQESILHFLAYAVGGLSIWLIYWAIYGVPAWEIAEVALAQHYELVTTLRRYDWWVIWNLIDVLIFASPFIIVSLFTVHRSLFTNYTIWGWTLLVGLLILNFAGSTRGEVGRIWLFLFVLLALVATPRLLVLGWQSPILILLLTLSIGLAWRTVRPVILVTFPPDVVEATASPFEPFLSLSPEIALQSQLQVADDLLHVSLIWQAQGSADYPYTTFVHVVNADGELVAQSDGWAVDGAWPPTCWRDGTIVDDSREIDIAALPSGSYAVMAGMYNATTADRLAEPITVGTFTR